MTDQSPARPEPTASDYELAAAHSDVGMLSVMVQHLKAQNIEYAARLAAAERALDEARSTSTDGPV